MIYNDKQSAPFLKQLGRQLLLIVITIATVYPVLLVLKVAFSTDVDFGIFMRKGKEYYAGISATHLAEVQMSSLSIVPTRHFYFERQGSPKLFYYSLCNTDKGC